MMKSREQIITDMCYTYRHDYGLVKALDDTDMISSGITEQERKRIWDIMSQIFDRCVAPYMEFKNESTTT